MRDERISTDTPNGTASGSNINASNEWLSDDKSAYVSAYKEGTIEGGLISDVNIKFNILKEEDYTVGVSFDVYNIFDTDMGVVVADPSLSSEGISFWLGIYAEF